MNDSIINALLWVLFFFFGGALGFISGKNNVADECLRLGGFYVGTHTFECKEKVK